MADLIRKEGKPEHREIRLRLLEMDVPDSQLSLPAWATVTVEGQSLVFQIDDSEHRLELPAIEVPRISTGGWSKGTHTATIAFRDPYEVVEHFNIVVGSRELYWIKAFAKMCREKLGILVEDADLPF